VKRRAYISGINKYRHGNEREIRKLNMKAWRQYGVAKMARIVAAAIMQWRGELKEGEASRSESSSVT